MGFGPITVPGVPGLGTPPGNPGTKPNHPRVKNAFHASGTPLDPEAGRSYPSVKHAFHDEETPQCRSVSLTT